MAPRLCSPALENTTHRFPVEGMQEEDGAFGYAEVEWLARHPDMQTDTPNKATGNMKETWYDKYWTHSH